MPGVRLVGDPLRGPAQHPVEDSDLLHVVRVRAQPADDLHQELLVHGGLRPSQRGGRPGEREIVAVHHAPELLLPVVEAAGRREALHEAHLEELCGQECLPPGRGVPGAVQAPAETSTHARLAGLRWQVDVNQPVHGGVQVRLARVHDQDLAPSGGGRNGQEHPQCL